jgi:YgiT-type zinc finger domain-containing protein
MTDKKENICMTEDFCVRCGSGNIKTVSKRLQFTFPNPGTVTVTEECNECQECGETYFSEGQMHELSLKLKEKTNK